MHDTQVRNMGYNSKFYNCFCDRCLPFLGLVFVLFSLYTIHQHYILRGNPPAVIIPTPGQDLKVNSEVVHQGTREYSTGLAAQKDQDLKVNSEVVHQGTREYSTGLAAQKGCMVPTDVKSYSQSREDLALFYTYFTSPVQCHGVFVEIGALDGIKFSNTKFYEDNFHWTGVLIEGNPSDAAKLKTNRPQAKTFTEAVCEDGVGTVDFIPKFAVGGIKEHMTDRHLKHFFEGKKNPKVVTVPCRPIGAMLREATVDHIDLFSLDVEGAELLVLRTMDWSIPTRVLLVETGRGWQRDRELLDFIHSKGFSNATWNIREWCPAKGKCTHNQVFINHSYVPELYSKH